MAEEIKKNGELEIPMLKEGLLSVLNQAIPFLGKLKEVSMRKELKCGSLLFF